MNTEKVFAKMLKAHSKGECVTLVTDYGNAKDIAKLIMSMPDTYIEDFQLTREDWDGYADPWLLTYGEDGTYIEDFQLTREDWDGYADPWLLTYGEDGDIWCQKAVLENGHIAKGEGAYIIDTSAIGSRVPEDFVLGDTIKVVD